MGFFNRPNKSTKIKMKYEALTTLQNDSNKLYSLDYKLATST